MRYAALLRAVNLGGGSTIAMADLRKLLTDIGYSDVSTYVQSGNAVFTGPDRPAADMDQVISAAIAERLGVRCAVMLRTSAQLAAAFRENPLRVAPDNPSRYFVAFLGAAPQQAAAAALMARSFEPDKVWVSGNHAYLWCPNGAARTKLTNTALEKSLGVTATSRNWNTVTKLVGMTAGQE